MSWTVLFHPAFDSEFRELSETVQDELLAHANMKELRFDADDGVWRVAFAFDPKRRAVLLVAGDKSGGSEDRFYRQLLRTADKRFDRHVKELKKKGKQR